LHRANHRRNRATRNRDVFAKLVRSDPSERRGGGSPGTPELGAVVGRLGGASDLLDDRFWLAVDVDQEHRLALDRQAQLQVTLDAAQRHLVNHLQRKWDDPSAENLADRSAGDLQAIEG